MLLYLFYLRKFFSIISGNNLKLNIDKRKLTRVINIKDRYTIKYIIAFMFDYNRSLIITNLLLQWAIVSDKSFARLSGWLVQVSIQRRREWKKRASWSPSVLQIELPLYSSLISRSGSGKLDKQGWKPREKDVAKDGPWATLIGRIMPLNPENQGRQWPPRGEESEAFYQKLEGKRGKKRRRNRDILSKVDLRKWQISVKDWHSRRGQCRRKLINHSTIKKKKKKTGGKLKKLM